MVGWQEVEAWKLGGWEICGWQSGWIVEILWSWLEGVREPVLEVRFGQTPVGRLESRDAILLSIASGQNAARISSNVHSSLFEQIQHRRSGSFN